MCVIQNCSRALKHIESLGLVLELGNIKIYVITIYKPPKGNIKLFTESVSQLISSIRVGRSEEVVVGGDFNIDLLEHVNSTNTQHFLAILQSLSLLPTISKPTRITNTTATLLDHICC